MTLAAIMGSLVDARNIGTHKSVKLTIHVPAERAMQVFEAFGWPTMAEPVAVAVARLNTGVVAEEPIPRSVMDASTKEESPGPERGRSGRGTSPEKRLVQQAGICCADPVFQRFLSEQGLSTVGCESEKLAAVIVRSYCGVASRADILPGTVAEKQWDALYGNFLAWKNAA